jgi:surface protein
LDIIQKDRANINTIVSDCHLILKDLYLYFKDGSDLEVDVIGDPTMAPLNNDLLDYAAGWVMTITFEVEGYTVCAIPMNPIPPFTPICEDADYQITDTDDNILYSGTIPSGGSLDQTIADSTATLKDTADNVLSTTQILAEGSEDIVAPDATYTVEYLNGTPIQSGNILSGGFELIVVPNPITCEDATAELYFDGELIDTMQIPAGDTDAFNIDCSTTLNAVRVTSVSLSHAHTGTFVYVGDVNGKPSYEKSDDADRIIYYDGTRWILEKLGGGAHTHEAAIGNEAFPWLADWSLEDISMVQATIGTYCQNGGDALNILVNGNIEGDVNNAYPVEIELTDGTNSVTPDAVTIIGNTVTIEAPDALVRFRYANITTGATFTDLYPIVSGGEKFLYIENSLAQLARAVVDATRPVTTYRLRDSAITLKNTANATLSTTNVPATVNQDITAPDATVTNSDASYTDTVVSGGTLVLPDITVTDSDGSTYTQPSVENVVCTLSPDTSLEVNGTPEGTFAAGSTIEVNITDGVNPVTPDNVTVVGDVVTIEVPSGGGGGWVRPSDWLTMPTLTSADEEIAILHAVWNNDSNYAAFRCTTSAGDYDVDWGDGTTTSHASNTTAEHQYDYATYDTGNATLSTRGYKQAIIRITPATGTLTTFSSDFRYTGQNQNYSTGFLDVLLSMPSATTGASILFQGTLIFHRYIEQVHILNSGGMTSALSMFSVCNSLQSVPLFNTASVTNMSLMFNGCRSLQSVPLFNTSSVTNMSLMFQNCFALQSVPLFDTSSVTNMSSMFQSCSALKSVPLFDTSSVTNMSLMFNTCSTLQSVPLFDTSSVTNMSSMFNTCFALQTVPLFDTSSVTNMSSMFQSCSALQEIPTFVTSSVTNITIFASSCSSMSKTDIICRTSVAFNGCQLSQAELVNIFNNLLDRTLLASANINITGNYGAAALTVPERAIATLKNWTITG